MNKKSSPCKTKNPALSTGWRHCRNKEGILDTASNQLQQDCYRIPAIMQYCTVGPKLRSSAETETDIGIHPSTLKKKTEIQPMALHLRRRT